MAVMGGGNYNYKVSVFREHMDESISISRSLRKERELVMYGDEKSGIPLE